MRIWRIINIEKDFGRTRIILLSLIVFVLTFSFSYVLISFNQPEPYSDQGIIILLVGVFILYPIHKFFHYLFLVDYHHSIKVKMKFTFRFIPLIHLKVKKIVPKYRYIMSLLAPFILLNALILFLAIQIPMYAHYACILFGMHNLICLIDLLNVNGMLRAPHNALIEETPKGYEVLVPVNVNK